MYADNLFTLNKVPTLSVGGGFGSIETSRGGEMPVGTRDEVFVSVVQYGRIVLEKSFSGFGSVAELLSTVRMCLGSIGGLVTVNLRNRTCGMTAKRVMRLGRPAPSMPAMA